MKTKRILWIDDDIESSILRPYLDELYEKGFAVEKVKNPDDLSRITDDVWSSISAIIIDVIMPTGEIDNALAKGGMKTGFIVLKNLLNNEKLKNIKKIVFSIVNDVDILNFCHSNDIPILSKQEYMFDSFVEKINELT